MTGQQIIDYINKYELENEQIDIQYSYYDELGEHCQTNFKLEHTIPSERFPDSFIPTFGIFNDSE